MTRSVPLMMNVPLSVISGMSPKKTSSSLASRIVLDAGVGVLVVDEEAEGDLQRNAVGHAALLALLDRVLHLQVDGVAADVADLDAVLVDDAAARAGDRLLVRVVGDDLRAAVRAGHAQVLETLELAALALPVADRELDEVERAGLAEVARRGRRW